MYTKGRLKDHHWTNYVSGKKTGHINAGGKSIFSRIQRTIYTRWIQRDLY